MHNEPKTFSEKYSSLIDDIKNDAHLTSDYLERYDNYYRIHLQKWENPIIVKRLLKMYAPKKQEEIVGLWLGQKKTKKEYIRARKRQREGNYIQEYNLLSLILQARSSQIISPMG